MRRRLETNSSIKLSQKRKIRKLLLKMQICGRHNDQFQTPHR